MKKECNSRARTNEFLLYRRADISASPPKKLDSRLFSFIACRGLFRPTKRDLRFVPGALGLQAESRPGPEEILFRSGGKRRSFLRKFDQIEHFKTNQLIKIMFICDRSHRLCLKNKNGKKRRQSCRRPRRRRLR